VRQNFISPTGDEFTLINHDDVTRVQHLNAARNKRRSVSAGYKHGTPKLFTGHSSSEALKKKERSLVGTCNENVTGNMLIGYRLRKVFGHQRNLHQQNT
jgi:hypothetical protein